MEGADGGGGGGAGLVARGGRGEARGRGTGTSRVGGKDGGSASRAGRGPRSGADGAPRVARDGSLAGAGRETRGGARGPRPDQPSRRLDCQQGVAGGGQSRESPAGRRGRKAGPGRGCLLGATGQRTAQGNAQGVDAGAGDEAGRPVRPRSGARGLGLGARGDWRQTGGGKPVVAPVLDRPRRAAKGPRRGRGREVPPSVYRITARGEGSAGPNHPREEAGAGGGDPGPELHAVHEPAEVLGRAQARAAKHPRPERGHHGRRHGPKRHPKMEGPGDFGRA
mmetsp:Transcript_11503/g.27059  ORF Transcript_11503/g.27059 Transcript_11503/m.27059 type:complete len:280 (-) Transcript_11503:687-1526(-)